MNIKTMKKINDGRSYFQQQDVKKSGKNKYQHFNYFELQDIIPVKNEICTKFKIADYFIFDIEKQNARLEIYDLEQDDHQDPVTFQILIPEPQEMNSTKRMQEIGALQTYSHRYLLLQFLDVTECDRIDATNTSKITGENKTNKKVQKSKTKKVEKTTSSSDEQNQALIGLDKKTEDKAETVLNTIKDTLPETSKMYGKMYLSILDHPNFQKEYNYSDSSIKDARKIVVEGIEKGIYK
ncbi:ERF family protein [Methanosphaera cuniculi]|uniref:ERF superfamily protein n=1 Tax=Methanosphaera cuniculi TaxID=1077256 RepID=A0A2A2HEI6_9EURY|nr:ERF family protein [Methanosphaera cuniculi]PAV07653.1 hypothetical protein ASJ82_08225 [Methanosphaera cuniculi]PWL08021.1 ERF superfamily protein [Methanosphaera cuniculi]